MSRYLSFFFLTFVSFLLANDIDLGKLEKEIFKNNRAGNQKISQQKLSELLISRSLSKEEEGEILFFDGKYLSQCQ